VVLALRQRNGELLGVMEAIWPGPLTAFTTEIRQHLPSLSAGCARVVAARLAHGDLAAAQPKAAVFALLDGLADSVLVVQAIRDDAGQVTDFSISHVSPGFCDPAGRAAADLTRLTLLEAYPASVAGSGLFARAMRVLADGVPQHVPGPLRESLASGLGVIEAESEQAPLAGLRVVRFFDGVIFSWHRDSSAGSWVRRAELLDHAQRLGRLGGWEEDLVTGTVRWTDSAFDLFGLVPRPGAEIPLADLHSYVMAADKPVVKRFRQTLPGQREDPPNPGVRRTGRRRGRHGGGPARRLPGRLGALSHPGRAGRHPRSARGQRAARRGGASAGAPAAAGDHAA
jgi:hypothetical protein